MAARRSRQGLGNYSPKRAQAARFRAKPGPRPDSKLGRRLARKAAARGRLPKPGTAAARARYRSFLPDTEEVRWLRQASLSVTLDKRTDPEGNPYLDDLNRLAEAEYRKAYNAQQRERKAARGGAAEKVRKLSWTWVKRHKRRIPGR